MPAIVTMTLFDPLLAATSAAAGVDSSIGKAAPQRQVPTLRGTRRPHDGQTRLKPVWPALSEVEGSWAALSEVDGSGMSHNKGLNDR